MYRAGFIALPLPLGRRRGVPSFFDTIRLLVRPPVEKQNSRLMRAMFHTVAPRYDFITRAFSYGMDGRWKQAGVKLALLPENPVVLDLASGTGDFSTLV